MHLVWELKDVSCYSLSDHWIKFKELESADEGMVHSIKYDKDEIKWDEMNHLSYLNFSDFSPIKLTLELMCHCSRFLEPSLQVLFIKS